MRKLVPTYPLLLTLALVFGSAVPASAKDSDGPCDQIEMFSRPTCPHCARAREFLQALEVVRPDVEIRISDIDADRAARERWVELIREHKAPVAGVPAFSICGALIVGFDRAETTGRRIFDALDFAAGAPAPPTPKLPLLDRIDPEELGLPLFTVLLGLVDGLNPCAMWVLLILLSVLIRVRDRRKVVLIAGTFVAVSGVAYFAFMAAWLNLFLIIGFSRAAQVALALVALGVGALHMKDSFAPGAGPSLSIPDSAKPGLYRRVRRIATAEGLLVSLAGAISLAVAANLVELLCTAGLPALYTHVLSAQRLTAPAYYAYLGLYNLAYVFDDALMVTLAVVAFRQFKLQEGGGRWLKGLSGAVMLLLGLALLVRPEWLPG